MHEEIRTFARLFDRDLDTLAREVSLYPEDTLLWKPIKGQPTLGGNLALHLAGNLRHFIGAVLGASGFTRNREAEFAQQDLSKTSVLTEIQKAKAEVAAALAALDPACLSEPFPETIRGHHLSTRMMLAHLLTHLSFHLGQMDYHRRAATGDSQSAEPGGFAPIADH